ncbi:hypothetical protein QP919_05895 [Corynebacterium propinquum]|uniref:Uncharacterized protein n=1 Tax=Corynebacterium propinquum TaxID=43769 RepID=A0AAP4F7V2_9CORY|nr:hypothetical protein [Corynebacterium propinquum]MDK4325959.1 hypothetical protein [Corynebacterium propinquum]MDK8722926.1 hypothetical protein [Corynebacterium propinquum]
MIVVRSCPWQAGIARATVSRAVGAVHIRRVVNLQMALLAALYQPARLRAALTSASAEELTRPAAAVGEAEARRFAASAPSSTLQPGYSEAVLLVDAMPRHFRPAVERAMAVCLRSEPVDAPYGADPLTADWCTRWVRDVRRMQPEASAQDSRCDGEVADGKISAGEITVGCAQPICAPTTELIRLRGMVEQLAARGGFRARLRIRED